METYRKCIMILIDGARPDIFEHLLDNGDLPNIKENIIDPGLYRRILSAFPSTTGPAYLPYLTGCSPGTCNVPGIRWLDRRFFSPLSLSLRDSRSYVGLGSFFFSRDIRSDVETLFDQARNPASYFSLVNKGVGWHGNKTKFLSAYYALFGRATDRWASVDHMIGKRFIRNLQREESDFSFVVFPGVDEYSHLASPFDPRVETSFRVVDQYVGEAADVMRKKGKLEETLWVIVSDHGLTETTEHYDLEKVVTRCGKSKTFAYPKLHRRWSNSAVMISGNSMAHIYAKFNGSWREKNFDEALQEAWTRDLMLELIQSPSIAWVATQGEDGSLIVRGNGGECRARLVDLKWHYRVCGIDPLEYERHTFPLTSRGLLAETFDSTYPYALDSLYQLFQADRCGDMIVTANPGHDLRTCYEFPEHRSSHGSLHKEHMQVPFACSSKLNGFGSLLNRSIDVYPTVCDLLGWEYDASAVDGDSAL